MPVRSCGSGRDEQILAHHTCQTPEQIRLDTERDHFMTAVEAEQYPGLIDQVVHQIKTQK